MLQNMDILEERLRKRKTDSEEIILTRLKNASEELKYESEYDYTIINNDIEKSCQELIDIINKQMEDKMKKEKITVDDLLTKIPNKYELAIVAGKVAKEEFIKGYDKYKIMDNVFKDIMEDEIEIKKQKENN